MLLQLYLQALRQQTYASKTTVARWAGHCCFARVRLLPSSVIVCNAAGGRAGGRVDDRCACHRAQWRPGGRHGMAGQYGYVPLGRHPVLINECQKGSDWPKIIVITECTDGHEENVNITKTDYKITKHLMFNKCMSNISYICNINKKR